MKRLQYAGVIVIIFSAMVCISPLISAPLDPETAAIQAYGDIEVAQQLFNKATKLTEGHPTKAELESAMYLYIEAGKLFEGAHKVLAVLGTEYASQEDINNCKEFTKHCVDSVKRIQDILSR